MYSVSYTRTMPNVSPTNISLPNFSLRNSWHLLHAPIKRSFQDPWSTLKNSWSFISFISKKKAIYNYSSRYRRGQLKIFSVQRDSSEVDAYMYTFLDYESSVKKEKGELETYGRSSSSLMESVYLFHTDAGGQVKAFVNKENMMYKVTIEVSSLPTRFGDLEHGLRLHWGLFRSDSLQWVVLDSASTLEGTTSGTENNKDFMETPFQLGPAGCYALELAFHSSQAPLFVTFVLNTRDGIWIRNHLGKNFCVPLGAGRGNPDPLGFSLGNDESANFALYSRTAENVVLCLYDATSTEPSLEIDLDPYINRTGDVWHISLETLGEYTRYGYRCKGDIDWDKGGRFHARRILLDPYSKFVAPFVLGQDKSASPASYLGWLIEEPSFNWDGDTHPCLPLESLVIYRLNVELFTADKSSGLQGDLQGTFLGLIDKIYHLKNLGVNAVMLEPIFAFDRSQGPFYPYNFFAPMDIYGPLGNGISASSSLKEMVKSFHENGIEVILEVVYTHTAEKDDSAPETISFRGIDNSSYYILDKSNEDTTADSTNKFNCNHPVALKLILDSLRHWVNEYHVDGFSFSNSQSLLKGPHGENLSRPPLIEAITFDPVLSKTKIIADPCLPFITPSKEILFPHWKKWAEMNFRFHDDVRKFLRGDKDQLSNFATRLCGSGDIFTDGRGPCFSLNFITRNFGLSLVDLVSFSDTHESAQLSWNCGEEGPTNNHLILETRLKQIRNFLFILLVSLGVPVLNMGDEYGQTKGGSTHLNDRKPFDWDALKTEFGVQTTRFIGFLNSFRARRCDLLKRKSFLKIENLDWHGRYPNQPQWEDPSSSFIAVSIKPEENESEQISTSWDLYIAFNSQQSPENVTLPQLPDGILWHRLVDTSLPFPETFSREATSMDLPPIRFTTYEIKPHSCVLFEARSNKD
ncbi:isoamylase 2, chloroplastic isoform X2 [Cryptomeria japonica]|uniref:isoamylase 2, chloroplastic isoform X2 n=1 Tax=Cryptomeria japonica TaxID=3369 RepID=UPI0027D9E139|nr:isoamylase 2, chloroplastic isoform X2 [Cryptomeria japonica]